MTLALITALVATAAGPVAPPSWSSRECTSCYPNNEPLRELPGPTTLAACEAACLAESQCGYINIALHGNQLGPYCSLFATCASVSVEPGCGGGWWTTFRRPGGTFPAMLWPPTAAGFSGKVKAMWFGANPAGLDTNETLALMARHAVAGYGWQTGGDTSSSAVVGRGGQNRGWVGWLLGTRQTYTV